MQLRVCALVLFVIVLIVRVDVIESKGGRDGGGGRGGSTGPSDSKGFNSNNRGGGISTSSKGAGMGSLARSSTFKSAIAGAAAGYITYQAGKAIINTAGAAMMWGGRPYYWGPSYYQYRSGYEMCSMPLTNSTNNSFSDVYFSNMTRPKQIVWSCRSHTEYCCGYECCPTKQGSNFFGTGLLIFCIILLIMLCCGGFLLYKFYRKLLDCILGSNDRGAINDKSSAPLNPPVPTYTQPTYTQSYPAQPYGNQAYPPQPQYPQQPQATYGFKSY
uniref:CX domain-containing protein n=1 Tax=Plectus sambesii TaxID=2011161 RepID=A0A914W7L2_9BILA